MVYAPARSATRRAIAADGARDRVELGLAAGGDTTLGI
jgi:hypothetical protein